MLKIHHFPELEAPALRRRTWEEAIQGFQRQFLVDTLRTCSYSVAEGTGSLGLARPQLGDWGWTWWRNGCGAPENERSQTLRPKLRSRSSSVSFLRMGRPWGQVLGTSQASRS